MRQPLPGVILCALAAVAPIAARQAGRSTAVEAAPEALLLPPALDRVLRDYESAWRDGDGQRLASLFTDDGFAVQSGSPIARGRAAIAKQITGPGGELQLTAYAYAMSGEVGHIVGGYRYPQRPGPPGRFVLALLMGRDGRWLIAADLDNTGPRR